MVRNLLYRRLRRSLHWGMYRILILGLFFSFFSIGLNMEKACNHSSLVFIFGYRQVTIFHNKHRTAHAFGAWTFDLLVLVEWIFGGIQDEREQELKARFYFKCPNGKRLSGCLYIGLIAFMRILYCRTQIPLFRSCFFICFLFSSFRVYTRLNDFKNSLLTTVQIQK